MHDIFWCHIILINFGSLVLQSLSLPLLCFRLYIASLTKSPDFSFRYKYENDKVSDAASPDSGSPFPYQAYGNGKTGTELSSNGNYDQLLERQVLLMIQIYTVDVFCSHNVLISTWKPKVIQFKVSKHNLYYGMCSSICSTLVMLLCS